MTKTQNQVLLALGCLAAAAIYFRNSFQAITPSSPAPVTIAQITTNNSGTVDLSFQLSSPSGTLILPNDIVTLTLNESSSDHVTGVQLDFSYDPSSFSYISLTPSSSFPTILAPAANSSTTGKITATYGATVTSGGVAGTNTLATLKLRALKAGATTISFGNNTLAYGTSSSNSVLRSATDLPLTVTNPLPGDFNHNNSVDLADYNLLVLGYGTTYTMADYNTLVANYGRSQ